MTSVLERVRHGIETIRRDFQPDGRTPPFDFRTTAVFVVSTVLLTVFFYYGKSNYYHLHLASAVEERWGDRVGSYVDLLPYVYWGATSLVLRVLVPLLVIVAVFRESPTDWGFRLRGQLSKAPVYVALYVAMLPFLYWASTQASFQARYPFYEPAAQGGARFWWYELFYGLQFVGVEAFFRGFMIFGLYKRFGWYALLIVAIPYVMIHFNKPIPETLGALVAGVVLGYLAIKSKSFVNGIALHFGIAVTMDLMAIAGANGGIGGALRAVF